jgi:hypothetical protein
MPTAAPLPDIVLGETLQFVFEFDLEPTQAQLAANYRLGISANRSGGADLLSVDFGPANLADESWVVTLTPSQTGSLRRGTLYLGVWDRDTKQPVSDLITLQGGTQPGRPTS